MTEELERRSLALEEEKILVEEKITAQAISDPRFAVAYALIQVAAAINGLSAEVFTISDAIEKHTEKEFGEAE